MKQILGLGICLGVLLFAATIFTAFPTSLRAQTSGLESLPTDRTELERRLKELEQEIEENQKKIETFQKEGKTLKNEINSLEAQRKKLDLQIKSINLALTKLDSEIVEKQKQINRSENKIDLHKEAISRALRSIYEGKTQFLGTVLLANNTISDFFGRLTNVALVENSLRLNLEEIVKLRQELLEQKQELALEKEDKENLKTIQENSKKGVVSIANQKSNLLKVTQGKESEYQKLVQKSRETAAQIRSRIFELLGGGELTFERAYDYARLTEGATGVRAAMVLAILHRESLLGKNVGRCKYDQTTRYGTTAMSPKNIPIFLGILQKLNIDPSSIVAYISCPNSDGTYGGAMGPAQFIPSTWKIFEEQIARITGNNPPSPWNNSDAFAATGLYLKQYGANSKTTSAEKKAAAIYYCGTNWQRYSCTYYANKVVEQANKFQEDINILNSNGT